MNDHDPFTRRTKTTWDAAYLERKHGPRGAAEWVNAKRRELETRSGAKWTSYYAHGKINFTPVGQRTEFFSDPYIGANILEVIQDGEYHSLLDIWRRLHDRNIHLDAMIDVTTDLIRRGTLTPTVARSGDGYAAVRLAKNRRAK